MHLILQAVPVLPILMSKNKPRTLHVYTTHSISQTEHYNHELGVS